LGRKSRSISGITFLPLFKNLSNGISMSNPAGVIGSILVIPSNLAIRLPPTLPRPAETYPDNLSLQWLIISDTSIK